MPNNNSSFFDIVFDFLDLNSVNFYYKKTLIRKQKVDKPTKAYLLLCYIRILLYIDFEKNFQI